MSRISGPNISRDSIVLYLDASNPKSYIDGSSVWYDLSGMKNDYINYGAVFSNNTFTFTSSSSQYMLGTTSSDKMGLYNNSYTIETMCTCFTPTTVNGAVFSFTNSSPLLYGTMGLISRDNGGFMISNYGNDFFFGGSLTSNTWYYVTAVYNIQNTTYSGYINGVFKSSTSGIQPLTSQTSNFSKIGKYDYGGGFWDGNISMIRIYNRVLSEQEILQNFNSLKSRFGL